jgi:hypothetical protein
MMIISNRNFVIIRNLFCYNFGNILQNINNMLELKNDQIIRNMVSNDINSLENNIKDRIVRKSCTCPECPIGAPNCYCNICEEEKLLTTCNTDPVGNVPLGMVCVPVSVEAATDAISPEATCVKAIIGSPAPLYGRLVR